MTKSAGPVLKRLYDEFGGEVEFLTLYVREAHPGDRYPQPRSFREKLINARVYKERDRIPWPVMVDEIEGGLHKKLDDKANAAYIVDVNGETVFRSLWSNDYTTLYKALSQMRGVRHDGSIGQNEKDTLPLMRGMGELYDTLEFAGGHAKTDVLREVPPLYVLGRVAALFRPLSPLARSLFALAGFGAAAGIMIGITVRRFSRMNGEHNGSI